MRFTLGTAILFLAFIIVAFSSIFFVWNTTRNGQHQGFVTAVEQQGYLIHNYTVYFKTDNSSSQEDAYCINRDNQQLAETLKEYGKSRSLVAINFDGVRGFGFFQCTDDEIVGVEKVN